MTVAASRAETNEANIGNPLVIVSCEPGHRARATNNAGGVPIEKSCCFSVGLSSVAQGYW
jgi:hypothetical protein